MTMPFERTRAVIGTEQFLKDLLDSDKYPELPQSVRDTAKWCLRHYPTRSELQITNRGFSNPNLQCPFADPDEKF